MRSLLLAVLAFAVSAPLAAQDLLIEEALPGVRFSKPVQVVAVSAEQRYYVVEQGDRNARPRLPSRILTLAPGDTEPTTFLDLRTRVAAIGGETGLLGLAFHPDYATNGRFFVHYTAPQTSNLDGGTIKTRISEFARSASDALEADSTRERIVLEADQPATNHNGGSIDFGPDGYLYIALGDGGGSDDQFENGQDLTTLLGTISRIDVDDVPNGESYGIPADNPFVGDASARPEIFAYGLRNPFKMDVSAEGIFVGDVGQNTWEEVNRVEAGGNYGWNTVEGPECFQGRPCDLDAFE
ncbi:PQQ-dependent sugar dehydrogenase, partial [Rubrivirga sp.]|uniref:PQQ-dependent sugar dehydrogenase n=1 Tax=Rubrivirga sp. TaxID=1885344 RepID=UPI003C78A2B5